MNASRGFVFARLILMAALLGSGILAGAARAAGQGAVGAPQGAEPYRMSGVKIPVPEIDVSTRQVLSRKAASRWDFTGPAQAWKEPHDCTITQGQGTLLIKSQSHDPYFHSPRFRAQGPVNISLRMKSTASGPGQVFFITRQSPGWSEARSVRFNPEHDGQWREYSMALSTDELITGLRLDPATAPGDIELDWIALEEQTLHPLSIQRVSVDQTSIKVKVRNHSDQPRSISIAGPNGASAASAQGGPGAIMELSIGRSDTEAFSAMELKIKAADLPELTRTLFLYRDQPVRDLVSLKGGDLEIQAPQAGMGLRILRQGKTAAILHPLAHRGGKPLTFTMTIQGEELHGRTPEGDVIRFAINNQEVRCRLSPVAPGGIEGPVVRVPGPMRQGLLAGVEYISRGEPSSSKADIETAEHLRITPNRMDVTMPLMAFVTDQGSVAMTWSDMKLQPVFASPNYFEGTADHRMALRGNAILMALRIAPGALEPAILWGVQRNGGLPELPAHPRSPDEQFKLCMAAFNGPLKTDKGWGHCVEENFGRHFFTDHASSIYRITGRVPELPAGAGWAHGGGHLPNNTLYFVTGRAQKWLDVLNGQAAGTIRAQKPDGSFRYDGKFARTHFEDTSSGICGQHLITLMEHAWLTGNQDSLKAGLKGLAFAKEHFTTPRGAQVWEVPLHTPDIMASAHLVRAHSRAFQMTGDVSHLEQAQRWALTGLPFVYQWQASPAEKHKVMPYATTPVFGATNWVAPNWIGLPVQWCGLVYADALLVLEEAERGREGSRPVTGLLDWRKLSRGILIVAEQMQPVSGPMVGLLPDSWHLGRQEPYPYYINPTALISLRLKFEGRLDNVQMAMIGGRRIVSPFPVQMQGDKAVIEAPAGVGYQIVLDGKEIRTIQSTGRDELDLKPAR